MTIEAGVDVQYMVIQRALQLGFILSTACRAINSAVEPEEQLLLTVITGIPVEARP